MKSDVLIFSQSRHNFYSSHMTGTSTMTDSTLFIIDVRDKKLWNGIFLPSFLRFISPYVQIITRDTILQE